MQQRQASNCAAWLECKDSLFCSPSEESSRQRGGRRPSGSRSVRICLGRQSGAAELRLPSLPAAWLCLPSMLPPSWQRHLGVRSASWEHLGTVQVHDGSREQCFFPCPCLVAGLEPPRSFPGRGQEPTGNVAVSKRFEQAAFSIPICRELAWTSSIAQMSRLLLRGHYIMRPRLTTSEQGGEQGQLELHTIHVCTPPGSGRRALHLSSCQRSARHKTPENTRARQDGSEHPQASERQQGG